MIGGVGHQTDFTIADFVADVRAATPSNAAELVVRAQADVIADLDRLHRRARTALSRCLERARQRTHALQTRSGLGRVPLSVAAARRQLHETVARARQAVRGLLSLTARRRQRAVARLDAVAPARRLAAVAARLARVDVTLRTSTRAQFEAARARLQQRAGRLDALSPLAVLGRGYAVCWDEDRRRILRRAEPALEGRTVHVRLAEGELACRVTRAEPSQE